jgi:hypothetical protein
MRSCRGRFAAWSSRRGPGRSPTPSAPAASANWQALRALANRWLEILWHCLHNGVRYDEAIHTANRNRALGKAA